MKYDIADYQPSDQENLIRFFRNVFSEMGFGFDLTSKDQDLTRIPNEYQAGGGLFLMAKEEDLIVGTIGLRRVNDATYELKRFYVLKTHRQNGIGSHLLSKVIEHVNRHIGACIRLDTSRRSPEAVSLFGAYGFVETERFNDDPFAEIFMELKITGANIYLDSSNEKSNVETGSMKNSDSLCGQMRRLDRE
ncbi:MAG: GNAT family N-acetyltransferase [Pontiellaceae bacterium]|jgi:GNAT superfamily N-acetyltransferase|nr:GNAT family N-acetyltransferase [Pontiellaceae bacterium]